MWFFWLLLIGGLVGTGVIIWRFHFENRFVVKSPDKAILVVDTAERERSKKYRVIRPGAPVFLGPSWVQHTEVDLSLKAINREEERAKTVRFGRVEIKVDHAYAIGIAREQHPITHQPVRNRYRIEDISDEEIIHAVTVAEFHPEDREAHADRVVSQVVEGELGKYPADQLLDLQEMDIEGPVVINDAARNPIIVETQTRHFSGQAAILEELSRIVQFKVNVILESFGFDVTALALTGFRPVSRRVQDAMEQETVNRKINDAMQILIAAGVDSTVAVAASTDPSAVGEAAKGAGLRRIGEGIERGAASLAAAWGGGIPPAPPAAGS